MGICMHGQKYVYVYVLQHVGLGPSYWLRSGDIYVRILVRVEGGERDLSSDQ